MGRQTFGAHELRLLGRQLPLSCCFCLVSFSSGFAERINTGIMGHSKHLKVALMWLKREVPSRFYDSCSQDLGFSPCLSGLPSLIWCR